MPKLSTCACYTDLPTPIAAAAAGCTVRGVCALETPKISVGVFTHDVSLVDILRAWKDYDPVTNQGLDAGSFAFRANANINQLTTFFINPTINDLVRGSSHFTNIPIYGQIVYNAELSTFTLQVSPFLNTSIAAIPNPECRVVVQGDSVPPLQPVSIYRYLQAVIIPRGTEIYKGIL